jgi:hypothetical protein
LSLVVLSSLVHVSAKGRLSFTAVSAKASRFSTDDADADEVAFFCCFSYPGKDDPQIDVYDDEAFSRLFSLLSASCNNDPSSIL